MAGSLPLILKSVLVSIKCRCYSLKKMIPTFYPPMAWDPATSPTYGKCSASFYPRFEYIISKSVCPLNSEHPYSRKLHIYLNKYRALHKVHIWGQSRGMELSLGVKYQVGYQAEHCKCWRYFFKKICFCFSWLSETSESREKLLYPLIDS